MLAKRGEVGAEVLLTGVTGLLGKVLLHELLRRREELGVTRVRVPIRAGKRGRSGRAGRGLSPEERFRVEVAASPCFKGLPDDWMHSVDVIKAELTAPGAGLDDHSREELTAHTTHVIHCAASVHLELPLSEAAAANITSALRTLEVARACPGLASMVSVSTAYVTPHPGDGVWVEERLVPLPQPAREIYASILDGSANAAALLSQTGNPNTYTLTKSLTEHLLVEKCDGVRLAIIRPSIISASLQQPFPGWIDSPAGFAAFILMIGSGRMRVVIGDPRSRLDVVPVDVVANCIIDAAFASKTSSDAANGAPLIRHAVAGYERSLGVAFCARRIQRFFWRNPATGTHDSDVVARVRYLGPEGLRYRFYHWLHHQRRPKSRSIADRVTRTNRIFGYFTRHTFRFRVASPSDDGAFEPEAYIETVCKGVARHLMGVKNSEVSLAGRRHPKVQSDVRFALSQPQGNAFIRLAVYVVTKVLRRCTDWVSFDLRSFEGALAATPQGARLVIVPSHRSYLDFVLVSYLAFARPDLGITIPHVAAAIEFARIPVLGWLFRRFHAFYLQRGFGRENKMLTRCVRELIRGGGALEFFIEGTRSRARRFLPPHRGLLRSLQATGEQVALLPVYISYDHVPEEASFLAELQGAPKPPMRLRGLFRWTLQMMRGRVGLGRIHLVCGRLVILDLHSDVHDVSHRVMAELQTATAVTTHHLKAFLERVQSRSANALARVDLRWLEEAVTRRGGRVLATPGGQEPLGAIIERCMRYQFEHLFYAEAALAFAGHPAVEHYIRRNSYRSVATNDLDRDLGDPCGRQVLQTLFEPVCEAYAAVAEALGSPAAPPRIASPVELVRAQPAIFLPDAEAAFEDLTERGVLVRQSRGYVWGPRATEIDAYRAAYAWRAVQEGA